MASRPGPGEILGIPCRRCGRFARVELVRRVQQLRCGGCLQTTEIRLSLDDAGWRIRTAPAAETGIPAPPAVI